MSNIITFLIGLASLSFQMFAPEPIRFETDDHIVIDAVFELPIANAPVPAVIFIHQGGSSKEEWVNQPLFKLCLNNGFAVLAYDVRNHGHSGQDKGSIGDLFVNPNRAPHDLKAAIYFLNQNELIDNNRIAIVGSSIGGNLACAAMNNPDFDIKTAVAISCKTAAVQGLAGTTSLAMHNLFLISSKGDQGGKRAKWAKELYSLTTGKKKLSIAANSASHGSSILNDDPVLNTAIMDWLKTTL